MLQVIALIESPAGASQIQRLSVVLVTFVAKARVAAMVSASCTTQPIILCFPFLQTKLPQLSALHHNNCMYIAHHLLTLGHQFRSKLPEPLNQSVASFVDLVPTIRNMGEKCFLEQLVSISNLISPSV